MFITRKDIERVIGKGYLDTLLRDSEHLLNSTIDSAVEEVRSYLQHRYNVDFELRPVNTYQANLPTETRVILVAKPYSQGQTYTKNDTVEHEGMLWVAQTIKTKSPSEQPIGWKEIGAIDTIGMITAIGFSETDDRNQALLRHTCSLTLYYLLLRHQPRQMADTHRAMHDEAKRWLEQANRNQLTLTLRLKENPINRIIWGSNPKRVNDY